MRHLANTLAIVITVNLLFPDLSIAHAQGFAGDSGDEVTHKDVTTFVRCAGYDFKQSKDHPNDQDASMRLLKSAKLYFDKANSLASKENFTMSEEFLGHEMDIGTRVYDLKNESNSSKFENLCSIAFMAHIKD